MQKHGRSGPLGGLYVRLVPTDAPSLTTLGLLTLLVRYGDRFGCHANSIEGLVTDRLAPTWSC